MIIYGKNTVIEAINNKRPITKLYLSDANLLKQLPKFTNIEVVISPTAHLNKISKGNHQGMIAVVQEYQYADLDNVIAKRTNKKMVIAMLDGLEDPHNLGAILRSADATGVDALIVPKNRSVGLNATVAKVSTGAIEHIDCIQVTNLVTTLKKLKNLGFWIIGLELDGQIDYRQQDYQDHIVIVIGSEGKGISRLVKEECDFLVQIPMHGHVNSLNASVSAALIFYEVFRNRGY